MGNDGSEISQTVMDKTAKVAAKSTPKRHNEDSLWVRIQKKLQARSLNEQSHNQAKRL